MRGQGKQESQLFNSENYCNLLTPCLVDQKTSLEGEHIMQGLLGTVAGLTKILCEINDMQDLFWVSNWQRLGKKRLYQRRWRLHRYLGCMTRKKLTEKHQERLSHRVPPLSLMKH